MRSIIILAALLVAATSFAAEEKRVCVDKVTKDGKPVIAKDGKPQQECKVIKVHKKLEVEKTEKK